jgi:hypothetical protein
LKFLCANFDRKGPPPVSQSENKPKDQDAERAGRRSTRLTDGALLPESPPAALVTDLEKLCYSLLREDLTRLNCALAVDIRAVVLAARRMALADRFSGMVANLKDDQLTTVGGNGQERMHPVFAELAKANNALNQSLGSLLLTPRSRSSSRLAKGDSVPQRTTPGAQDEEGRVAAEMGL